MPIEVKNLAPNDLVLHLNKEVENIDISKYAENKTKDQFFSQSYDAEDKTDNLIKCSPDEFLNSCMDNNNGYFFIKIDEKKKISYGMLTGLEDSDKIRSVTPLGYMKNFSNEKLTSIKTELDILKDFKRFNPLLELVKVKKANAPGNGEQIKNNEKEISILLKHIKNNTPSDINNKVMDVIGLLQENDRLHQELDDE